MTKMKFVFEENLYDFLQWCEYEIDLDKLKREVQKEADRKAKTNRY
jgi:hypothetical protein